jgi:hypothetical protein
MIKYTGTVNTTSLKVRSEPNGLDTGKRLAYGNPFVGVGNLVVAGSYSWMNITSPYQGWIASEFTRFTTEIIPDPDPVEFPNEVFLSLSPEPTAEKKRYILTA